jgi:hypothetical protein
MGTTISYCAQSATDCNYREVRETMGRRTLFIIIALISLSSCTTAAHGTFAKSTFLETNNKYQNIFVGKVVGESSQTYLLYLLPVGEAPSTSEALSDAESKIPGTKYLTNLSIDNITYWKFGYSIRVIKVEANAYK